MFDFLFIGNTKRFKNRLNVRSFVRIILENNRRKLMIITKISGQKNVLFSKKVGNEYFFQKNTIKKIK